MSLNSFKDIFATLSFGYRVGRSMLPGSVNNRRHYTTCAAAPASERNPPPGVRNEVAQTLTLSPRARGQAYVSPSCATLAQKRFPACART